MKANLENAMKTWGSEVIPKDEWIDPEKKYTCNGKQVINIQIKLHNACGSEVAYPVKGTVILREKPIKTEYRIWSLNGKDDIVWNNSKYDLKEVK